MKKLMISTAVLAVGSMLAWGAPVATSSHSAVAVQGGQGQMNMAPADRAKAQAARLKTSLSLTDDQASKVEAAYVTFYTATAMKDGQPVSADDRTKANDKLKADLKAAGLTDEQVTTATARSGGRRGGGGGK